MKRSFRSIVAALALLCAGGTAQAADPIYPVGGRIGFVMPSGFVTSTRFPGFEDKTTGASMLVIAMPPQAFADLERQMSKEAVKKQGIVEDRRENLTLPNGKAVLIAGHQEGDGKKVRKWIFIGSVAEASALVIVQVPEESKDAYPEATVRATLSTMTVREHVPIEEELSLLPIKFDELSGLRPFSIVVANGQPTGAFLTEGPKDTLDATEQPLMIVSLGAGNPEDPGPRDTFARNLFSGIGNLKEVRIVGAEMLRLSGMQTHQLMAEAKDARTEVPMKIVQWIRFGPGVFLRFVGVARADAWDSAFPHFRAVRDGVNPRS